MPMLVVAIPPRPKLRAGAAPGPGAASLATGAEIQWALSSDGVAVTRQGVCAPALLPRADSVVAVLAPADVSWHRVTTPKVTGARMRAALAGVLEEALLEDTASLHFALGPGAKGGESAWVATVDYAWLAGEMGALERQGRSVDRIVPSVWPDQPPSGHFHETAGAPAAAVPVSLAWSHPDGVSTWPLAGGLSRALLPQPLPEGTRFTATPAVAAPAERWLGAPVRVVSLPDHMLQAARSLWNLRQFGLAAQHRGLSAMRAQWRRFMSRTWRPVRYGLAALVAVQLLGLNIAATVQRNSLAERKAQMVSLLQTAHPQIRSVIDPALQMQRETDALRVAAGRPGDSDLEPMLQAAASAWPKDQPVQNLRFEPGRLTLAANGWSDAQIQAFRDALSPAGWAVESAEGRLTLSRRAPGTPARRT
ncbi:MAG TPA: type II secretion system protein GspL [Burkholderiaceae bacterium]|jgi:general secretion pathway protein L|nr:type II secretion system protein GspL [Burkholderiaceae bacterium]